MCLVKFSTIAIALPHIQYSPRETVSVPSKDSNTI